MELTELLQKSPHPVFVGGVVRVMVFCFVLFFCLWFWYEFLPRKKALCARGPALVCGLRRPGNRVRPSRNGGASRLAVHTPKTPLVSVVEATQTEGCWKGKLTRILKESWPEQACPATQNCLVVRKAKSETNWLPSGQSGHNHLGRDSGLLVSEFCLESVAPNQKRIKGLLQVKGTCVAVWVATVFLSPCTLCPLAGPPLPHPLSPL